MRIVIVGAGIGGLTAALALMERGFEVEVLEQARQLGEIGAGVQISPNGTRVLSALGLGAAIDAVASEPLGKRVRLWNSGQTWNLFDLGAVSRESYGFPYLTMHRGDLHRVLVEAVRERDPQAIRLDCRVDGVRMDGARVALLSEGREVASGDLVVGADGVHSQLRRRLFGDDQPRFSGIIAWRGVIEASALPAHLRQPYGYNWVGPGAHVIHYPMRNNSLVNLVCAVERDEGWGIESWSQRGSTEEFLRDFAGWHDDVQQLIKAVDVPYKWALMVRDPMPRWSEGRATLLGDACHPTLPFLAQGAVMAIEDGYVLARCLAEGAAADLPAALASYERARLDRTARIVRGSAANAQRFHNPALAHAEGAADYVANEWSEPRVKERYEWLFEYDAETVAL
jgi:salicylate hydroxylase